MHQSCRTSSAIPVEAGDDVRVSRYSKVSAEFAKTAAARSTHVKAHQS